MSPPHQISLQSDTDKLPTNYPRQTFPLRDRITLSLVLLDRIKIRRSTVEKCTNAWRGKGWRDPPSGLARRDFPSTSVIHRSRNFERSLLSFSFFETILKPTIQFWFVSEFLFHQFNPKRRFSIHSSSSSCSFFLIFF